MNEVNFDKKTLAELCEKHGLKLLVLHGSYAAGRHTEKSDIDIGLLSRNKIGKERYFEMLKDFGHVFGDRFDPAFLNSAEPMISYRVALTGKPLFEDKKGAFAEFKVQSMARYMDTKKFRDLERAYVKKAAGNN